MQFVQFHRESHWKRIADCHCVSEDDRFLKRKAFTASFSTTVGDGAVDPDYGSGWADDAEPASRDVCGTCLRRADSLIHPGDIDVVRGFNLNNKHPRHSAGDVYRDCGGDVGQFEPQHGFAGSRAIEPISVTLAGYRGLPINNASHVKEFFAPALMVAVVPDKLQVAEIGVPGGAEA